MLEAASGLPTGTVFKSESLIHHDDSSVKEDSHAHVVWDKRAGLYVPPCGVRNECDKVRMRDTSVLFAKSHAPFLVDKLREAEGYADVADVGIGASVVVAVRNPLDNYYAWHRYLKDKHKEASTGTFHEYVYRHRRTVEFTFRNWTGTRAHFSLLHETNPSAQ